ncbi:MAG: DUF998 domain-containing protein [Acidimicrobiia bacterium]|nr:DUF998 domain-containing protein [Acidimicrobiia bacterium]NNF65638.1 DUF998 domain-containing protein [Acidimicrobiia bacterium]
MSQTTIKTRESLAVGAIVGPVVFIASWVLGGMLADGYRPATDAISRLAAKGASTAPILSFGLATYGIGVGLASIAMRRVLGSRSATALGLNAILTFGVLATPLEHSSSIDRLHTAFAASAYVALALASLLAAHRFRQRGWSNAAAISAGVGGITAASLAATGIAEWSGLFQRIGLTVSDVWMMAVAVYVLRSRGTPIRTR